MSSVDIVDLHLSFGATKVLENLHLNVAEGEFLVLLGPSGCGKSTLLNCIAGLLDINDGQIFIDEHNVTWAEPKDRGIGMVFQSYALYPQMNVEKNLSFGLRVAGFSKAIIRQKVAEVAHILQIEDLLKRKPAALSGGQRQRVAIGRALVRDVGVFLFDEPLSNLDAKLRTDLRIELKRLHRKLGNTMIYVTHDQMEALTLADRIAVMKNGVIQQLDTPNGIYHRPKNRFVADFVGSPSMNLIQGTLFKQDEEWLFRMHSEATQDEQWVGISLTHYPFTAAPAVGQKVELGIRPEHVILTEKASNSVSSYLFLVDLVEPMGPDVVCWGSVAGEPFKVRVSADFVFKPDTTLMASFDLTRASIFDIETGGRI